ncbi:hypothetical protein ABZ793_23475 [Micromonospora sp. NPDC047465]|uniref:hypothetical protein n=1 Tax=Micromonospora sp. NPDC047465 TaxID=3154813 RepID=UPI0033D4BAF1
MGRQQATPQRLVAWAGRRSRPVRVLDAYPQPQQPERRLTGRGGDGDRCGQRPSPAHHPPRRFAPIVDQLVDVLAAGDPDVEATAAAQVGDRRFEVELLWHGLVEAEFHAAPGISAVNRPVAAVGRPFLGHPSLQVQEPHPDPDDCGVRDLHQALGLLPRRLGRTCHRAVGKAVRVRPGGGHEDTELPTDAVLAR